MILYYSRTRKTKAFAEILGEITGLQVYELESDLSQSSGFSFMLKAFKMIITGKGYPVSNMPPSLPEEIYLCGPVWGGKMVGPPRYFLDNADLRNTKVNILLTAAMPVVKHKQKALEYLSKIPCKSGKAYIFATSDDSASDKEALTEQIKEMLSDDND